MKIVIVGASSGIGHEVAKLFIEEGNTVGVAARRTELLDDLKQLSPERVFVRKIDVCDTNAGEEIVALANEIGGMDCYLHVAGIGAQNRNLDPEIELRTVKTNSEGWTRCIVTAYNYFKTQGYGHIAAVSSIAGTKGLGAAPAYSATKRMQNCYLQALAQKSRLDQVDISFTDIRPGFVNTALLDQEHHYPMMLTVNSTAKSIVKAIEKKKRVKVIDWRYAILTAFWKCIPNWLWERLKIAN